MRKFIHIFFRISLIVFGFIFNAQAATISPELLDVLKTAKPDQNIDVIIILTDQVDTKTLAETKSPVLKNESLLRTSIITTLKTNADETQTNLKTFLYSKDATNLQPLWIVNAIAATLRADVIPELARQPEVAEVRLNFAIQLSEAIPATATTPEWNIDAIRAPELWNLGFTGQNIVVANMDSGVDVNHNDLVTRYRDGSNSWFDPYGQHASPHDSHPVGHGTGTMGIMVGGDATGTAIGVAPGAQWIAVKMFDDNGFADLSAIHQSFQWLLDPDGNPNTDDAPDVVNNSWGFRDLVNICYLEFQQDIQALRSSQIAVVFSAGNEGINGPASSISPANNPESFAVGAVSGTLNIAGFSSRGPSACVLENDFFPEVVAPGVGVKTADLTFSGVFPIRSHYVSGTSFAAPHVAGAMALLLSAFPGLTVSELEAALIDTAEDLGDAGPDNDYGFGMVDVMAAYRSLVPCTDFDGDQYYLEAVCGTAQDCNDNNAGINPGAPEIKGDGTDQDCNGSDLTIDILSAVYNETTNELEVMATSTLATPIAPLQLDGYGLMTWNEVQGWWEITVIMVGPFPQTVTVSGAEGFATASAGPCNDGDNDGFYPFAVCGLPLDCDDDDVASYPGAPEFEGDGIDQDCNGYDLTIDILSAKYFETDNMLCVTATSSLNENADLILVGYPPMIWNPANLRWEITIAGVGGNPGQITVQGIEGVDTKLTTVAVLCRGDLDTDGDVDIDDLGIFAAAFGATSGMQNYNPNADLNGDGDVDAGDLAILTLNFNSPDCSICP